MQIIFESVADLADALRWVAELHSQYEAEIGHADPDWPIWYARQLAAERKAPRY